MFAKPRPSKQFIQLYKKIMPSAFRQLSDNQRVTYNDRIRSLKKSDGYTEVSENEYRIGRFGIETLYLKPKSARRRLIIYFRGSDELMEEAVDEIVEDAEAMHCEVLAFNYPDSNKLSTDITSYNELIDTLTDFVRSVITQFNLHSYDVVLKGHSLGGALATEVTHKMHQAGQPIYLFSGRSFASFDFYKLDQSLRRLLPSDAEPACRFKGIPEGFTASFNAIEDRVIPLDESLTMHLSSDKRHFFSSPPGFGMHAHSLTLDLLSNSAGQTSQEFFYTYCKHAFSIDPLNVMELT